MIKHIQARCEKKSEKKKGRVVFQRWPTVSYFFNVMRLVCLKWERQKKKNTYKKK